MGSKSFFLIFRAVATVVEEVVLVDLFLRLRQMLVAEGLMMKQTAVLLVKELLIESWGSF